MKATLHTYICIKRLQNCQKYWQEMSVEKENPVYGICNKCYEQMCADEREQMKGVGE